MESTIGWDRRSTGIEDQLIDRSSTGIEDRMRWKIGWDRRSDG